MSSHNIPQANVPRSSPSSKFKSSSITSTSTNCVTDKPYKPIHIFKNLNYTPKDSSSLKFLSQNQQSAYNSITERHQIDINFEFDKTMGPISGILYHQRVLAAYQSDKLKSKDGKDVRICLRCGVEGHKREECE